MKKQIIVLVTVVVILLAIIAGLILIVKLGDKDSNTSSEQSSSSSESISLWNYPEDQIKSVAVENIKEAYNIELDGNGYLYISMYENLPKYDLAYQSVARLANLYALEKVVDYTEDYAKYGLDTPISTVTINFKDNSSKVLYIGDESPKASAYYASIEDDNAVYLISGNYVNVFNQDSKYFVARDISPNIEDTSNTSIDKLIFNGEARQNQEIIIEKMSDDELEGLLYSSGYNIIKPKKLEVSIDKIEQILNGMLSISATDVVEINPSAEKLQEYGFGNNSYSSMQVEYSVNNQNTAQTYKISIGNKVNEDSRYAIIDDQRYGQIVVYTVPEDSIPWLNYKYTDMASNLVLLPFIDDVARVEVVSGSQKYIFDLKREDVETTSNSSAEEAEQELVAYYNNKQLDTEQFKKLYTLFISAVGENPFEGELKNVEPSMQITYKYIDQSKKDDVLKLIPINDREVAIDVNGEVIYSLRSSFIDKVLENINLVITGEKIITNDW